MKIAALVFAIIGALNTLVSASYTYAYGSFFHSFSQGGYGGSWKFFSIVIPIAAIIGAGSLWSAPKFGGWLLLGCAFFILMMIGFNFLSMISRFARGLGTFAGCRWNLRTDRRFG